MNVRTLCYLLVVFNLLMLLSQGCRFRQEESSSIPQEEFSEVSETTTQTITTPIQTTTVLAQITTPHSTFSTKTTTMPTFTTVHSTSLPTQTTSSSGITTTTTLDKELTLKSIAAEIKSKTTSMDPFPFVYTDEDYSVILEKVVEVTGEKNLDEFRVEKTPIHMDIVNGEWVVLGFYIDVRRYFDGVPTNSFYSFTFQDEKCVKMIDYSKPFDPTVVKPLRQPTEEEKEQVYNSAKAQIPEGYVEKEKVEHLIYYVEKDNLSYAVDVAYGPPGGPARTSYVWDAIEIVR